MYYFFTYLQQQMRDMEEEEREQSYLASERPTSTDSSSWCPAPLSSSFPTQGA